MLSARTRAKLTPYLFLAVPLVIYLVWVIGPMLYTFFLSLTNWDGLSAPEIIGTRNYVRLFKDPVFEKSLINNLKWVISFITIPVVAGLALAMALNRAIPGSKFFKAAFYSPLVLSLVVSGLIWSWMYQPAHGLINEVLRVICLDALTQGWLSDPDLVMWSIIAVGIWRQVGYVMILYLAGLQTIPQEVLEAATVDGAGYWRRMRHIIWPMLHPITLIVVILNLSGALQGFELPLLMTDGGPAEHTNVVGLLVFNTAFGGWGPPDLGLASAYGWSLFVLIGNCGEIVWVRGIGGDQS